MAVVGEAQIVIRAITAGFQKDVENALKDIKPVTKRMGEDVGKDFSRSVSKGMGGGGKSPFSRLAKEADAARKTFNKLIKTGYALGPAIAGAISAVGDLVGGLFAVGSAVGAAAPALAVLPGLLAAIAQGALTAKLAFGGVAKGIGALLKQKTGSTAGGGANNDAAIEDARRRLAQVYQQAAEKMAAANDKVRKAQIALNQAYEEGAESLQQLGFDAEDAAIAQQKAAIELERARETLLRVQDLPPNSRARREAELAFKQADLDYRQAADRSNDLAKAQEYAAETGIEGTKEVQSAKEDLAEAEADLAKTQRDNAQDILEAQLALQRALQKTNQNSAASVDLLKDLSAEARRFALYVADLKPEFLKLRAAAGEKLFGPLTIAIDMLVMKLFPVLKPMLTEMGGVIGNIARRFAEMLTRVDNLDIIKRVFGGANIEIMRNLGHAFVDVAEGALNILDAVAPLTIQFSEFIKKTADAWVGTMRFKNATGELTASFERAAEFAKSIGGLLSSAFGAFKSLGAGASDSGKKIIDAFAGAFDKLKAFADEGNRTGALQEKFDAIANNVIAIGGFLGEVAKMFYQISGNEGVMAFFNAIKPIPGIFAEIFNEMTSTGQIFGDFLVNIALLLKAFTETGGIEMFFGVLNEALKIVVAIFSNEIVQKVFLFLAAVKGITLAFGLLFTVLRFTGLSLLGNVTAANGLSASLGRTSLSARSAAIQLRAMRIAGLGIGSGLMPALSGIRKNFMLLGKEIYKTTVYTVQNSFAALKNGIIWLFSRAGLTAVGKAFTGPIKMMAAFTKQIWLNTLAWLANPIGAIVAGIVIVIAALGAVVFGAYQKSEKFQAAVRQLGDAIKNALGDAFKLISGALEGIMPKVSSFSDALKKVGDFIAKYIMPAVQFLVVGGIKVLASYITYLIGLFKIFLNILIAPFRLIYAFFKSLLTGDWSIIRDTFTSIIDGIIGGVNTIIDALNSINPFTDIPYVPYMDEAKRATQELEASTVPLTDAQEAAKRKMEEMTASAANLNVEFGSLKEIQATVRSAIETTFDSVTEGARSFANARDAAKAFKEETDKLTTTLKDGSLAPAQMEDALVAYGTSVLDAIKKDIELGGTFESTSKIMEDGTKVFMDNATAILGSADAAEQLAIKMGLTPETLKKTFKVSGLGDLQSLTKELGYLETLANTATGREDMGGIGNKMETIRAKINTQMTVSFGKRSGQDSGSALYVKAADGSFARGGSVGKGDTILVGEKGPEFFVPGSDGNIIPNNKLSSVNAGGASPVVNVYPSQGMDEVELAHNVSRQLAWTMRRGV
jgi:hypothetical protein